MDLSAIASIGGSALSFLGGRKSRKMQEKMYWQNRWDNLPEGIRANAEAAGFNPLVFAGPGVGNGAGYQPTMGHELSTAGQVITDASLALENQKIRRSELELENKRLEELVKANTLRPTVPGVYGARNGQANRQNPRSVPGNVDGSGDLSPKSSLRAARLGGAGDPSSYNPVEAPALKAFGLPWTGSGLFSTGESWEDALGDSPLSWIASPLIAGDMFGYTIGQAYSRYQQSKADKAMEEWFRRERENDPFKRDPFEQRARKIQSQNPYYRP